MAMISQKSLVQLRDMNTSFWAEVSQNPSVPQSVKSMIYQHLKSFWIPNAHAVVISPIKSGQNNPYLKQSVFDLGGFHYYYPSLEFWIAHSERAHSPNGAGCDPEAHAAFLTTTGQNAEFIYAVVKTDGTLVVEDLNGFVNECAFYESGVR